MCLGGELNSVPFLGQPMNLSLHSAEPKLELRSSNEWARSGIRMRIDICACINSSCEFFLQAQPMSKCPRSDFYTVSSEITSAFLMDIILVYILKQQPLRISACVVINSYLTPQEVYGKVPHLVSISTSQLPSFKLWKTRPHCNGATCYTAY